MKPSQIATELQALQRQRVWYLKSRIMVENRLTASVAGTMGYSTGLSEKERQKHFAEAGKLIKEVSKGNAESPMKNQIMVTMMSIDAFEDAKKAIEREMLSLAKQLPVAKWIEQDEQRGFGLMFLAIIIGESGDLANYPNPGKLWKRFGCAPISHNGKNQMPSTWRMTKGDKLPAEVWTAEGYSPRRHSIAYLIGDGLMKQNKSVYRARYEEAKESMAEKYRDSKKQRFHRHGLLLAAKLLLKNLWIEWNKVEV